MKSNVALLAECFTALTKQHLRNLVFHVNGELPVYPGDDLYDECALAARTILLDEHSYWVLLQTSTPRQVRMAIRRAAKERNIEMT